ncbi:hypothetical protein E4U21_006607 [Claviceps maximensis]|nr:hypothetical protein E4U21_006607 [Claviceps maximensis]
MFRAIWFQSLLALLLATQALLLKTVLCVQNPPRNAELAPPTQDPFYDVPSDIKDESPGKILASRKLLSPITTFGIVPDNIQDGHQFLYRTTDRHGKPTATVMTVLIPRNANLSSVMSFQMAENAISRDCAPSYEMTAASNANPVRASATTQLQILLVQAALADGWVVTVPDFQGPAASFVDQKIAGHAILDALRASIQSYPITGINENAILALWGYSAGAAVTKYAAEIQPKYAAELNLAAVAIGGVNVKGVDTIKQLNSGPHTGLLPFSLIGVANENPNFKSVLNRHLKAEFKDQFYSALNQCLDANLKTFDGLDVLGMFTCWDLCVYPSLKATLAKYAHTPVAPTAPVYWYHDFNDEVSPIAAVDDAVFDYCKKGANVYYQRDIAEGINHKNYGLVGAPNALAWMKDVMVGKVPEPYCTTENVTISDLPQSFLDIFPLSLRQGLVDLLKQSAA